jgi:hypothetical protein
MQTTMAKWLTEQKLREIGKNSVVMRHQKSWSRLSEQIFRVDKWSVHRGYAAMRIGSGLK